MKIKIDEITEEGLELASDENPEAIGLEERDIFQSPVKIDVRITMSGDNIYIKARLNTEISLECSRCLEPFQSKIKDSFQLVFIPKSYFNNNYEEEVELTRDELDINYYEGEYLDISDIIRQQLLLDIPVKPLCKKDCLGLCPVCGVNRNIEKCSCCNKNIDPRLSMLKNLFDKQH